MDSRQRREQKKGGGGLRRTKKNRAKGKTRETKMGWRLDEGAENERGFLERTSVDDGEEIGGREL